MPVCCEYATSISRRCLPTDVAVLLLRIYKASNTKCNAHLPRDNIKKTLSLYNSRQLIRADRCCLIDEMRFLAPLGVVSSNVPSSRLFAAPPLSVSVCFRVSVSAAFHVSCHWPFCVRCPCVLSATSPQLRFSVKLLTPTCPVEVRFRGLPRCRIFTVVVTSVVVVHVRASSPVRIFTWLRVTHFPSSFVSF